MDYQEGLEMALDKEKAAIQMYKQLSVKYSAMRDLFEFLMNEEEKHASLIKKKISELYR